MIASYPVKTRNSIEAGTGGTDRSVRQAPCGESMVQRLEQKDGRIDERDCWKYNLSPSLSFTCDCSQHSEEIKWQVLT